jgi:predicted GTPase
LEASSKASKGKSSILSFLGNLATVYLARLSAENQVFEANTLSCGILQEFIELRSELKPDFEAAVIAGELPSTYRVIITIGVTGDGKSSTCNSICGDNLFKAAANS